MALTDRIRGVTVTEIDTGFSPVPVALPEHESGDTLLVFFTNDGGAATLSTATSGWGQPAGSNTASAGCRSAVFSKVAASSSEPSPDIVCDTQDAVAIAVAIKYGSGVEVINSVRASGVSVLTAPSVVSLTDGAVVLQYNGGFDSSNRFCTAGSANQFVARGVVQVTGVLTINGKATAGTVPALPFRWGGGTDGGEAFTVIVTDSGSPAIEYQTGIEFIRRYGREGTTQETPTYTLFNTEIAGTIGGIATDSSAVSAEPDTAVSNFSYELAKNVRFTGGNGTWQGYFDELDTPIDATGKVLSASVATPSTASAASGTEGIIFVVMDGSANWAAFTIARKYLAASTLQQFFVSEDSTPYDSSGTLDWSDIAKVAYGWHRDGTSGSARGPFFRDLCLIDTSIFVGGGALIPVSPYEISGFMQIDQSVEMSKQSGSGQAVLKASTQIGNGSDTTYYRSSRQSVETPNDVAWQVAPLSISYSIYGSADCVFDFSNSITRSTSLQTFEIHPSHNTAATVNFNNASFVGWVVNWLTGVPADGAAFVDCGLIDFKASSAEGMRVSGSVATVAAMRLDDGAELINCRFTKGNETYAIELDAAGTFDLSLTEFSGYADPIYVSATTGTVTIALAPGAPDLDYVSDGATVVFDNAATYTLSLVIPAGVTGIMVLHDNDDSDYQYLGTELQRNNAATGTEEYEYATAKVSDQISVSFITTSGGPNKRFQRYLTLPAVDSSFELDLISETN